MHIRGLHISQEFEKKRKRKKKLSFSVFRYINRTFGLIVKSTTRSNMMKGKYETNYIKKNIRSFALHLPFKCCFL